MKETYDIFVIGTGVAGSKIASACSIAGKKVGICDQREFGGTCALRGCNPKKVLTGCAEARARLWGYQEKGIITGETSINWKKLINFKEKFVENVPPGREKSYTEKNIEMFKGKAEFIEHNKLKIGKNRISSDIIVIATGAEPLKLNIPGAENLITSEEFLNLSDLPDKIIFVGGGYVSFELASIANQVGADVVILERSSRPLGQFDPQLVDLLTDYFKEIGMEIKTETGVSGIKRKNDKFLVEVGSDKAYIADLVVHGAGRIPMIDKLALDKAEIEVDERGIVLDQNLRSISNKSIYVAGDAVSNPGSLPLTPVASLEARIVIHNILNEDKITPDYSGTASVLYTFPPLARVGILAEEAAKNKKEHLVNFADTSETNSTQRLGLKRSAYKIIIRKADSRIVGAHLLGHHVDEVINIFAMAIRNGFTAEKLKDNLWSFPSVSDVIDDMLDI